MRSRALLTHVAIRTQLHGLSLCAGIGGIELGLKLAMGNGYRTVCYVEGEIPCASILAARMQDGTLCDAPIWSDVKTFNPRPWRGRVDIVTAGYPCQPFSCAGKRKGADDPRHLWPYIARIIHVIRPRYVFCENVPGHVSLGLRDVRCDLQGMGYSVQAGIFSAAECGAPHIRKRLFVLAHADHPFGRSDGASRCKMGQPGHGLPIERQQSTGEPVGGGAHVADAKGGGRAARSGLSQPQKREIPCDRHSHVAHADSARCTNRERQARRAVWDKARRRGGSSVQPSYWQSEWGLDRLVDGVSGRVDAVRALGNAVVPAVACRAWQTLRAANRQNSA